MQAVAQIKCAHCKEYHQSVAEVRSCATQHNAAKAFSLAPHQVRQGSNGTSVPAGRYAIEIDNVLKFYRVSRPAEGRWAGRVFVDQQAGDDFYPVRNRDQRNFILTLISIDVLEASRTYGRSIGRCGVCNRTLTNAESIDAGIGPVCAARMGW